MKWKNMPYWLRGGIIVSIIYILIFLLDFPFGTSKHLIAGMACFPSIFIESLIYDYYLKNYSIRIGILGFNFHFFFSLIIYFIIGTLIGLIIGKIKSRNK